MAVYLVRRPEDSQLQKHLCCSTEGNPLTSNPSQIYKLLASPLSKDNCLIYSSVCNRNICQWVHQAIGRVPPRTWHNCLFPVLCCNQQPNFFFYLAAKAGLSVLDNQGRSCRCNQSVTVVNNLIVLYCRQLGWSRGRAKWRRISDSSYGTTEQHWGSIDCSLRPWLPSYGTAARHWGSPDCSPRSWLPSYGTAATLWGPLQTWLYQPAFFKLWNT